MVFSKWFLKGTFDRYVASQQLVAHEVYGSEFSICLDLKDIQNRNLSVLLGCYINEKKAKDILVILSQYLNIKS